MSDIKVPATSAAAQPIVVSDHFKLADSLQLALLQLGDGLFPISGVVTSGSLSGRTLKSLNGEVIAGSGLNVSVRDMLALLDGIVLTNKNKEQFNAESTTTLAVPTNATSYVVLRAQRVVGTDGLDRPDMQTGALTIENVPPTGSRSGVILATITVPNSTTQITSGMIDTSVRPYLLNMNDLQSFENQLATLVAQGSSDLDGIIRDSETDFKVDTALGISTLALSKGFVNVFIDASDIETGSSSNYLLNPTLDQILAVSGSIPASVLHYWKFDEDSGSTLVDLIGTSDGIFLDSSNAPASSRVAGLIGNGIDLTNGDRAYLGTGLIDYYNSDWSLSAWATYTPSVYAFLVSNALAADGSDVGFAGLTGTGWWAVGVEGNNYGPSAVTLVDNGAGQYNHYLPFPGGNGTVVPNGNFHQYVITYTASSHQFKVYFDGVLVTTTTLSGTFLNSANMPLTLGGDVPSPLTANSTPWKGIVDEVALWNVALSQSDITALFASIVPGSGAFVPGVVVSKAHTAATPPSQAIIIVDGTSDLVLSVSRDNGTTYTTVTKNVMTDISAQPSGTQMRWKVSLPHNTSVLDNIALFWK